MTLLNASYSHLIGDDGLQIDICHYWEALGMRRPWPILMLLSSSCQGARSVTRRRTGHRRVRAYTRSFRTTVGVMDWISPKLRAKRIAVELSWWSWRGWMCGQVGDSHGRYGKNTLRTDNDNT